MGSFILLSSVPASAHLGELSTVTVSSKLLCRCSALLPLGNKFQMRFQILPATVHSEYCQTEKRDSCSPCSLIIEPIFEDVGVRIENIWTNQHGRGHNHHQDWCGENVSYDSNTPNQKTENSTIKMLYTACWNILPANICIYWNLKTKCRSLSCNKCNINKEQGERKSLSKIGLSTVISQSF